MVSGQVFRLVIKRNGQIVVIAAFYNQALSFLLRFSRAYLYYAYGAHVPFLCTSTYRTGDNTKFSRFNYIQVIKNIRNVTRHRNGQSVKSRQTRWEWQLLISIMHIQDVVTRYNNCPFLCAWHVSVMVFFALPPCCVDENYSHVCVPKMCWWMIM